MKNICCKIRKNKKEELKKLKEDLKIIRDITSPKERSLIIRDKYILLRKEEISNNIKLDNTELFSLHISNNICDKCIKKIDKTVYEENEKIKKKLDEKNKKKLEEEKIIIKEENKKKIYSVKELIEYTKKYVIGQEELIEKLASVIYFHQLKIHDLVKQDQKITPLISGITGTGKTLTIKKMCELINVPFIALSNETFAPDGWKGISIADYLSKHTSKDNFDNSIIYIDEFDKITQTNDETNKSYNDLKQYRLLTFIEGEEIIADNCAQTKIDTNGFQVILSGAYMNLLKEKNNIGFKTTINEKEELKITKNKIVETGLLEELAGRITTLISTRKLDKEDYINILKNSQANHLYYYNNLFSNFNINIKLKKGFYESIAEKAFKQNYGAREINNLLFEFFQPLINELSYYSNNFIENKINKKKEDINQKKEDKEEKIKLNILNLSEIKEDNIKELKRLMKNKKE